MTEQPAPILDAATVILLRDRTDAGVDVYLMKRSRKHDFMASACVFPGGRLDEADCDQAYAVHAAEGFGPAMARERLEEPDLSDDMAMGIYACAARETFEEAGVLLAKTADGQAAIVADDYRAQVYDAATSLADLAEQFSLRFTFSSLVPYARWITPEIESKRFDTRFFVVALPAAQAPAHDNHEMVNSFWTTPADAVAEHNAGRIVLMPPTLTTLIDFLRFDSTAAVLEYARSKRVLPILPQAFTQDGVYGVMLPWDADYKITAYRQTAPLIPGVSRVAMKDGRWQAM